MVADRQIAAQVKEELIRHGAYFMTETEQKQLTAFLGLEKGTGLPDKEFIGKRQHGWLRKPDLQCRSIQRSLYPSSLI